MRRLAWSYVLIGVSALAVADRADAQTSRCLSANSPRPIPHTLMPAELQLALAAPAASGPFRIVLDPASSISSNPAAVAAFNRAAAQWATRISDPITVTIRVNFIPL